MPTAVSPSASSRRVTGTMTPDPPARSVTPDPPARSVTPDPPARSVTPDPPARSWAANSSRDGVVSPSRTGDLQLAVEAGALAGVAGRPLLVDEDQQRGAVAVQADVADPLAGARGLPPPPPHAPA